jgi:hypothetical protein
MSQCFENKFSRIVLAAANTSSRDLGNSSYVDEISCNPMTMVDFFYVLVIEDKFSPSTQDKSHMLIVIIYQW